MNTVALRTSALVLLSMSLSCSPTDKKSAQLTDTSFPVTGLCAATMTTTPAGRLADKTQGVLISVSKECMGHVPSRHTLRATNLVTGDVTTICTDELANKCLWKTIDAANGWYNLELSVSRDGAGSMDGFTSQRYQLGPTCDSVSLQVVPAAPALGDTIQVSASATCSQGLTPVYRFTASNPLGSVVLSEWGGNTVAWPTTNGKPGGYAITVEARQSEGSYPEASNAKTFILGPFCAFASLSVQGSDSARQLVATESCYNGGTPWVRIRQRSPAGVETVLKDWSAVNQTAWDTTNLLGTWRTYADVRAQQSPDQIVQVGGASTALAEACTSVSLSPPPKTVMKGNSVTFTAQESCPQPEYKFVASPSYGTAIEICSWQSSATCQWNTGAYQAGDYTVTVSARRKNSPEIPYESTASANILVDYDQDGDGVTIGQGDCHDFNAQINPSAIEVCDGYDNNCNKVVDEGLTKAYALDRDGDGFAPINVSEIEQFCVPPPGYSDKFTDCDDLSTEASPNAEEICGNSVDENCDGLAPACCGGLDEECCSANTCLEPATTCVNNHCVSCGDKDEACCGGTVCIELGTVCTNGTCQTPAPCGALGQTCCTGNTCTGSEVTCITNQCVACGDKDEACCGGTVCNEVGTVCTNGTCQTPAPCGALGQTCCAGDVCTAGTTCSFGTCVAPACGGSGQACCAGNTCTMPGFVCTMGVCQPEQLCGQLNEPCCSGTCTGAGLSCQSGICQTSVACGQIGQPCCNGITCTDPSASCSMGMCTSMCGAPGQPCCAGTYCATGFCNMGICQAIGGCGMLMNPCCPGNLCYQGMCNGTMCF